VWKEWGEGDSLYVIDGKIIRKETTRKNKK
jgi:hypothetical protein